MIEAIICWACLLYFIFYKHDPSWLIASGLFAIATNINQLKDKEDTDE